MPEAALPSAAFSRGMKFALIVARLLLCFAIAFALTVVIAVGVFGVGRRTASSPRVVGPAVDAAATTAVPSRPLPELKLQREFAALSFDHMTGMYPSPDGRIFVIEQAGRIMVFDSRPDVGRADVFLDIRDRVDSSSSEMGLLGFALA